MKIAFVAVNYNNWHISANYVSSVKAIRDYQKHEITIVIVDNASNENDYLCLRSEIEGIQDVILVRTADNLGYFGGLNYGIRQIDYRSYDYVIAGNNDLFFKRDFISILSTKKYENKQTVIVPDLLTVGGIHQNPQFIKAPSKKRQLGYKIYYSWYPIALLMDLLYGKTREKRLNQKKEKVTESMEIFQCTGAIMLLRPSFFGHCGLLDDSLFLWGEEVALAHQLILVGDKMLYDPQLQVIHMENASVGKIASYKKYKLWKKSFETYKNYYINM